MATNYERLQMSAHKLPLLVNTPSLYDPQVISLHTEILVVLDYGRRTITGTRAHVTNSVETNSHKIPHHLYNLKFPYLQQPACVTYSGQTHSIYILKTQSMQN
jgi:hypothetical protein